MRLAAVPNAGTVQFTSTDPQAVLPSNFVFGAGDLGTHTFTGGVTLKTTGGRTVTATDTVTPAITATSPAVTVAAAGAAKFVVTGAASQTAGTSQNLTLRAVDAFGNTATGYTGAHAITFSGATLSAGPVTPPTVTDNAGTARSFGVATNLVFSSGVANAAAGSNALTLYRAETANVTASATDGGSGSTAITTSGADRLTVSVGSAAANRLSVVTTAGNPQTAGTAFSATVTALDPFGNAATGYTGGIAFTTTDPLASPGSGLPAAYTFVPGDGGVHLFPSVTFKTAGAQTLTATDTVLAGITGTSAAATIAPTATDHFTLTHTAAGAQTAGAPFDLTVTAKDQFGNTTPAYTGTAAFTSSDIQAALPGSYAFQAADNGTKSFTGGVTLKTVGSRTVTATDTVTGWLHRSPTTTSMLPQLGHATSGWLMA